MTTRKELPEVSLITSWYQPSKQDSRGLAGVDLALREGLAVLDLYFLGHTDIPVYAEMAGVPVAREPHQFAASLSRRALESIANRLRGRLMEMYGGSAVGWHPRFAALATFFPNISLPPEEDAGSRIRREAVKAVRNALYLAYLLQCHCVEIVGGAAVPGRRLEGYVNPTRYREKRRRALAASLHEVFDLSDHTNALGAIEEQDNIPPVALELEPGPSFLLNSLDEYRKLKAAVSSIRRGTAELTHQRLKLNVDVAHAFLIGYTPKELQPILADVAHMHISDHAGDRLAGGIHASDLLPGLFHGYQDYTPWLQLAIKLSNRGTDFSHVLAVELEACNDLDRALAAVSISRRWLRRSAS